MSLRRALYQLVSGAYKRSSQGLTVSAEHLSKLQGLGQETLDVVADANEELDKLKEKLDTVTAGSILPLFKKPLSEQGMQKAVTEREQSSHLTH